MLASGCGGGDLDEIGALIIVLVNVVGGVEVAANDGESKLSTGGGGLSAFKKVQVQQIKQNYQVFHVQ